MRELNDRGARWVVVSDGPRPVWVCGEATVQCFDLPRVEKVVNPIGCGDCMAAGIATAIAEGTLMPDATKLGIAAAIDNLATLQPARLNNERVVQLAKQIRPPPQA
jgi:fructose-1-phosphate kinase PfkB-like protein